MVRSSIARYAGTDDADAENDIERDAWTGDGMGPKSDVERYALNA
jgi:hypothetical protein